MSDNKGQPEVEAHGDEVLNLQGIKSAKAFGLEGGGVGFGSCSSCVGSLCM